MLNRILTLLSFILLFSLSACSSAALTASPTQPAKANTPLPSPTPIPNLEPTGVPQALEKAQARLAEILFLSPDQVSLVAYEFTQWSDSCLGVSNPGQVCAQVITPGSTAVFNTPSGEFEVHTDETGASIRVVGPSKMGVGDPSIAWQRTGGIAGICQILVIDNEGYYLLQDCRSGGVATFGALSDQQRKQLDDWISHYTKFEWKSTPPPGSADVFQDMLVFYGKGSQTPSAQEQEAINEFVSSLSSALPGTGSAATPTTWGNSGIEGQALVGPTCPGPVRPGQDCADKPYPATFTILDQSGKQVAQVQAGPDGKFRVVLPPGAYTLHPEVTGAYPRAGDQTVTVTAGQYTQVQVVFDSGIR